MPGNANGSLDGIALKPLTVAFHEPGFIATLQQENQQPFWLQMSAAQRQRAGNPMGPANPQALNRYTYVLNSPLRYTDPSGHTVYLSHSEASLFVGFLKDMARELTRAAEGRTSNVQAVVASAASAFSGIAGNVLHKLFLNLEGLEWKKIAKLWQLASVIEEVNAVSSDGVAIATGANSGSYGYDAYILNRSNGDVIWVPLGWPTMQSIFGAGNEWDIGIAFGDNPRAAWHFVDDVDGRGLGPLDFCPPEAGSC